MKKLLMAVAALMVTLSVNAQGAGSMFIKPMAGGTLTTLVGDVEDAKMKLGLVGGAEFGYHISDPFAITAGLLYTMQGATDKETDIKSNLDYLNIPVMANYYVAPGLALKAGLQLGILARAKASYDGDSYDIKKHYNSIDFSIPVGLSYEISDFVIDARYNFGLSNIADSEGDDVSVRNSVIMLTIGYKIQL